MTYHIEYPHISGPKSLKTESIWEFSQLLDGVMANRENSIETIKIWTEENNYDKC